MDSMQDELQNQTKTIQRLEYENKKFNAQIATQTQVIAKQLLDIKEQKKVNENLQKVNDTLEKNNKHSFRNGIIIGLIPAVIILIATVILTQLGWL